MLVLEELGFKARELAARANNFTFPSTCYVKESHTLLVMGGSSNDTRQQTVEHYRIDTNTWENLFSLKVPRSGAGSCCHNGFVYIFCGITTGGQWINSIEKMSIDSLKPDGRPSSWELI